MKSVCRAIYAGVGRHAGPRAVARRLADGLQRQPADLGPVGMVGVYALPFVAFVKLRGKCN